MDLFDKKLNSDLQKEAPLADRMRPASFNDYVGQEEIVGEGKLLRKAIENDELMSIIFWGPPGSGKTTLAKIIAELTKSEFVELSAVNTGVKQVREVVSKAVEDRKYHQGRTILFIDEIHRFNKAQQDSFLPYVEKGIITLIGATTENPSFEVISPLLSRSRVFVLKRLDSKSLKGIIKRALTDKKRGLGNYKIKLNPKAIDLLIDASNGDARTILNALEVAVKTTKPDESGFHKLTLSVIEEALQHKALQYDKKGEEHYNVISAFIKSMRGSDPDAALYWLARMLEAGEDARFIARRMIIFASEDIGNADPQALQVALNVAQAVEHVGLPEAQLNLAQGVTYLASAPKSNASYEGLNRAKQDVRDTLNEPVPLHLRNAVTDLMKDLDYGKDYEYAHHQADQKVSHHHLPDKLKGKKYYYPKDVGQEKEIKKRLAAKKS